VDEGERLAMAQRAVDLARASGDRSALVQVLHRGVAAFGSPATYGVRREWAAEAVALADELQDPWLQSQSSGSLGTTASIDCDGAALRANRTRGAELAERIPSAMLRWQSTFSDAWMAIVEGDLALAEELNAEAFRLGEEIGVPDLLPIAGGQLFNIRDIQGRFAEVLPLIEQAMAAMGDVMPVYRAVLAAARLAAGDDDGARSLLEAERAQRFDVPADANWSTTLAVWTEVATALADQESAARLHELLEPYPCFLVSTGVSIHPVIAHQLGALDHTLGRLDEAEQRFAEAEELEERLGSPTLLARTYAAWAALLADRGRGDDVERARQLAERALAIAEPRGIGVAVEPARQVLERLDRLG
jgi:tetratricopeptide (TPR) repeat protein